MEAFEHFCPKASTENEVKRVFVFFIGESKLMTEFDKIKLGI